MELGTGLFFAAVALWFWVAGLSTSSNGEMGFLEWVSTSSTGGIVAWILGLVAFLYLAAISVALALIDLDTHTLPNRIVLPSYVVVIVLLGTASVLAGNYDQLLGAGIGMAALWLAYLAMALAYPGGMGFGDVKLAGLLGLFLGWLGWGTLIVGGFAAFLLGGLFSIGLLVARKAGRKSGIPFGPWMLIGAWVGIFFGEYIAMGYLTLVGLKLRGKRMSAQVVVGVDIGDDSVRAVEVTGLGQRSTDSGAVSRDLTARGCRQGWRGCRSQHRRRRTSATVGQRRVPQ